MLGPYYQSLRFVGDRLLYPSTSLDPWNPTTRIGWNWVTIPWNEEESDPEAQHYDPGGWTILYGPALVQATVGVRLMDAVEGSAAHVRLWKTDAAGGELPHLGIGESWEWATVPDEANATHVNMAWAFQLVAGEKLRTEVDYWHAAAPAHIVGGRFTALYWRPEAGA